jgi:hypothetical protein
MLVSAQHKGHCWAKPKSNGWQQPNNKGFLGGQLCQWIYKIRRFRDQLQTTSIQTMDSCSVKLGCPYSATSIPQPNTMKDRHKNLRTLPTNSYCLPPSPSQSQVWEHNQRQFCTHSYLITLMMEMELVSKTSDFINPLTWQSARETLTEFCCHENFKQISKQVKNSHTIHCH